MRELLMLLLNAVRCVQAGDLFSCIGTIREALALAERIAQAKREAPMPGNLEEPEQPYFWDQPQCH